MPVVQFPPVLLLRKSIPLEIVTKVGPVSPRIQIGSDLYTLSRFTFLSQIAGVTIVIPVDAVQYCGDVVMLTMFDQEEIIPTLSTACIII